MLQQDFIPIHQNYQDELNEAVSLIVSDSIPVETVAGAIRRRLYICGRSEKNALLFLARDLGIEIDDARIEAGRRLNWAKYKASKSKRRAQKFGLTQHFSAKQFLKLIDYYGQKCVHCGSEANLTVEHVQPMGMGGHNRITNIAITCDLCNAARERLRLADDPRRSWPLWFRNYMKGEVG